MWGNVYLYSTLPGLDEDRNKQFGIGDVLERESDCSFGAGGRRLREQVDDLLWERRCKRSDRNQGIGTHLAWYFMFESVWFGGFIFIQRQELGGLWVSHNLGRMYGGFGSGSGFRTGIGLSSSSYIARSMEVR